ncbi:MAG: DUF86 domain-containing protein [Acidobacteria bacterium]|nr:DUF86 domain-containing protein [Acidobacteriota bacterium]
MIDAILITRKINLIAADLQAVAPFARVTLEEYLADPINEVAVERYLERIISRMIDINFHVITESGHSPPRDYFESFVLVGKLGVLPHDFSRKIAQTAGLRNRLVHEYNDLDAAKVRESLEQALEDIPRYLDHVHRFCIPSESQQ